MNEEIKIGMYTTDEILEFMTDGEGRSFMGRSMFDAILDYITNLQEENHNLKELCDKYEEEHSIAFNLWKTNIIENVPALSDMQQQLEDYKSRNEKAIEYIKSNPPVFYDENLIDVETLIENEGTFDYVGKIEFISNLLNILKGE